MTAKPNLYIALLRGINVGGHTAVSMAVLKECFEKLGYSDIETYINSGNVIFRTNSTNPRIIEKKIEKALTETFGHSIAVVVRSFSEMQQLINQIPKSWQTAKDERRNVIFLRHTINNAEALKDLKAKPGIEELHYYPGVLFWSAKTSDLTKSNMLKLNRSLLYKEMTVRNLNTTLKIYELMRQA